MMRGMAVPTIVWSSASKKSASIRAVITEASGKPRRRRCVLTSVGVDTDVVIVSFLFHFLCSFLPYAREAVSIDLCCLCADRLGNFLGHLFWCFALLHHVPLVVA